MEMNIQEIFKQNLEYISQIEIEPEIIDKQFVKTNTRFYLKVGDIDCPTGKIAVADPLCHLAGRDYFILTEAIPKGKYPVEVAICRNEYVGIRMCTARLKIKNTKAIKYICAKAEESIYSGFSVDAGMMCFCDAQVAKEYIEFIDDWYTKNPNKNHYDDYFEQFFKDSELKLPQYQREGGDFIEWTNPTSKNKMVMIASGFGDGFYQSYWGYDEKNEICELIVPMVNPELYDK